MKYDKKILSKFFQIEPIHYSNEELVSIIRKFALKDPSLDSHDWDDFTTFELKEPYEQFVQSSVNFIDYYFREGKGGWFNEEGTQALLRLADAIEHKNLPFPPNEEEQELLKNDEIPLRYVKILIGRE